jgi:DNA-binding LacI/PurR family transcriptional regulator
VDVAVVAGILLPDSVMAQYKGRIRLVGVARVIEGFDAVQTDDFLGGTVATEHLIGLGHRSIVHLAATPADGYGARREGHEDAMRRAGLVPRVIFCDQNRSIAAEATNAMLDSPEPPSAVVAHNDQTALGVLDALHARGLRAPDDLSVIGYDNISAGRAPGTNLTTVDLHALDLGRMATEMAIRRSKNPSAEPMIQWSTPELIVRGSTGRLPL